ncbi:galectin-2 isoform X1 [Panthera uncia]|uniref:galectin-2 isoform X1 n=1 Tax=Panthera uncia TaxID=29064 RepID=UPI0020FF8EE7|nr:galectin-2 isoform X1 [Panthera uncia]
MTGSSPLEVSRSWPHSADLQIPKDNSLPQGQVPRTPEIVTISPPPVESLSPCAKWNDAPVLSPSRFALNLGQGSSKVDLHFNPRFSESVIVCNSLDGTWGEEQKDGHMCFSPGSEVKFTVTFDNDGFKVKLSDGHQLTFPNRMGHSHLSYLSIQGGLSITSFKID